LKRFQLRPPSIHRAEAAVLIKCFSVNVPSVRSFWSARVRRVSATAPRIHRWRELRNSGSPSAPIQESSEGELFSQTRCTDYESFFSRISCIWRFSPSLSYSRARPPWAMVSWSNTLEPRTIFFGTFSPCRIFSAVSIASAPPVGYWNVALRMPCCTYATPS